ncbi:hypothetical protein B0E42_09105 [Pseudomonas sp. A25(2017)]|nr:hypothetical protein B0E42_09105 [Pseudomonas sp. A25(2017)]
MTIALKAGADPLWRGWAVGAKLARETGASTSERPHRLHRGQALLPQSVGYIPSPQKACPS